MTFEDLKDLVENESRQFTINALMLEGILFETSLNSSWGNISMIIKLPEGNYQVTWDGTTGDLIGIEEA